MIDNFRSIKWLFHELEDVSDRVSQLDKTKNKTGEESQGDQNNWETLMERRVKNIENYNHNLANQLFSLLSSINNNIISLTGWIKDREMQDKEKGKDREEARLEDDS